MDPTPLPSPPPRRGNRLFKIVAGALAVGAAAFGLSQIASAAPTQNDNKNGQDKPPPADWPKDKPLEKLAGFQVREWLTGGAKITDDLQVVVVLHDQNSSPEEVEKLLGDYPGKARFVAPTGRYAQEGGFTFLSPQAVDGAAVLADEGLALTQLVQAIRQVRSPQRRVIVVGLGVSTLLALAMALYAGFAVRAGVGVGGWYQPALVPAVGGDTSVFLLTQASGPHEAETQEAMKLATARGFKVEVEVGDFDLPLSPDFTKKYLQPILEKIVPA